MSNDCAQAQFTRLKTALENPMVEVYLLFYQATLPVFTNAKKILSARGTHVSPTEGSSSPFVQKSVGKFVKPTEISANLNNLSSIDYTDRCNQVEDMQRTTSHWIYYTTNHYETF